MELSAVGSWAGQYGPFLLIIVAQWRVIQVLLTRLLAQQDIVIRSVITTQRTAEVAERSAEIVAQVVNKE